MTAFGFWLRLRLNRILERLRLPTFSIVWYCQQTDACYHKRENLWIDHNGAHFACTHCTNPHAQCRRCGAHYLDTAPPSPTRWRYVGLLRGWEHVGPCAVRD